MSRILLATALLVSLVAAGCADKAAPAAPEPEEEAPVPAADEEAPRDEPPAAAPTPPTSTGSRQQAPASVTEPAFVPPPPPPRIEVLGWNGSVTEVSPGAHAPPAAAVCCTPARASVADENVAGTFDVPPGLDAIVLELLWTDAQFDLDLALFAPDSKEVFPPEADGTHVNMRDGHWWSASEGNPGAPDRHAIIVITDAEALALAGTWSWSVSTKSANAVAFAVYASLHHDVAPAAGYSAAPAS